MRKPHARVHVALALVVASLVAGCAARTADPPPAMAGDAGPGRAAFRVVARDARQAVGDAVRRRAILIAWSQNLVGCPHERAGETACTRLLFSTTADGLSWSAPDAIVEGRVRRLDRLA